MDQTVIAGVGNVYRNELLYRHRIDPYRAGTHIDEAEFDAMWTDLVELMKVGFRRGKIVVVRPEDDHGAAVICARSATHLCLPPGRRAVPGVRHHDPHRGAGGPQPVLVSDLPEVARDNRRVELILVVVGAIVVTAIAHRRGLEPALVLVVVGFAVSFAPEFEGIELESEMLLSVVLPPLLYSAALDFSFPTFLRNIRPILGLGVGLVVVTAFAVAGCRVVARAVADVRYRADSRCGGRAARRRHRRRRRPQARPTEESDGDPDGGEPRQRAAALSLFSIAVAQVAGSQAFIENPLLLFSYSADHSGRLVGAALGYITLWIRRRLAHPGLETIQGLVVPFAAFISAEHLHASGVLAVVVAGFVVGHGSLDAGYQTRLQERYVWNSVDVMLEAFVFAYIGLQLRFVLEDLRAGARVADRGRARVRSSYSWWCW